MPRALESRVYTDELLRDEVHPTAGQRVLALGIDAPLAAEWARAVGPTGYVAAVQSWLPDYRRLVTEKGRGGSKLPLEPIFAGSLNGLDAQPFDLCALDIAAINSNRALLALTQAAAARLEPDGEFYAAGPKDAGILSFTKRLEELFGNARPLAYRKGQRVIIAYKHGEIAPPAPSATNTKTLTLRGQTFTVELNPAVFAGGDIDPASAMLIDSLEIAPADRILDLGCGAGLVGMVAARLAPQGHVTMTDAEAAALETTRANCARNGITNVTIKEADIADTIANDRFTVVACNPPFHQRHERNPELVQRFMRAAAEQLDPGGRAYFVANRFLAYESKLGALFEAVHEVAGDERYKVLCGVKAGAEE